MDGSDSLKTGATLALFHWLGNSELSRSRVMNVDSGSESSLTPYLSKLGLIRSGPLAFDGSIKEIASFTSWKDIIISDNDGNRAD